MLADSPIPRHAFGLIAFIVFVDMMGIGIAMPVMPGLIRELTGATLDHAAEIYGWLMFAYAFMQFLCAPVIGGLSDRYGRRPVLLVTLFLLGLDYALMAWSPVLGWLVFGRIVSGMMGATWAAANSCVADVVPPERRGAVFGLLGGAGAAGFVLGPAIGGLAGLYDVRLPFVIASFMALSGAAIGWFFLQETLPPDRRRTFSAKRANPIGAILQMAKTPLVLGCLIAIFFNQLAAQAINAVWSFYGALKFGWSPLSIGLTVAFYGILLAVSQGLLSGKTIARFGAIATARWSLVLGLVSYPLIAFSTSTWHVLAAIVISMFSGVWFPAIQSLLSLRVAEDAQGELQGAIASTISITTVIGQPVMTNLFGHFADSTGIFLPGAPFILSAVLLFMAIAILWRSLEPDARTTTVEPDPAFVHPRAD